ncbi:Gfo/Idh/MocA family protein [Angelakisella massiliensis]|uniref:Gfo/Idh/MocA family protein n=1 Tax=Angelakisella massiliensis TaxID=1871018 RepID=UPI0008F85742|nr:Gfo/Idh/MocA family oxidoreductase [Angelakisella massiliensis]
MRLATVGTSWITRDLIAAARQQGRLEPWAVCSRTMERGRAFGAENGIQRVFDSYEALLADPQVDVVYLGTPNSLHFSQMKAALLAGKAVICEKPFVSNMEEFHQIKALVEEQGSMVFEAITTCYVPNFHRLRDALNQIGPVHAARLEFTQKSQRFDALKNGSRITAFDRNYSGGALYDIGVYAVHLAAGLFGKPEKVFCISNWQQQDIDTSDALLLGYPEMVCSVLCSKDSHSDQRSVIQGENGYLLIQGSPAYCDDIQLCLAGQEPVTISQPRQWQRMTYELDHFVSAFERHDLDAVRRGLEQSERVMDILCRARMHCGLRFAADEQ